MPDHPWIDRSWIRGAFIGASLLLPAIVGVISARIGEPAAPPRGRGAMAMAVLKGYPYTRRARSR